MNNCNDRLLKIKISTKAGILTSSRASMNNIINIDNFIIYISEMV